MKGLSSRSTTTTSSISSRKDRKGEVTLDQNEAQWAVEKESSSDQLHGYEADMERLLKTIETGEISQYLGQKEDANPRWILYDY